MSNRPCRYGKESASMDIIGPIFTNPAVMR